MQEGKIHFSKEERQELRKLAGLAHERELAKALDGLYEKFCAWKNAGLDAFDLNDHIHQFHQGTSRDLWVAYTNARRHFVVARAIVHGVIAKEEVSVGTMEKLKPLIARLSDLIE